MGPNIDFLTLTDPRVPTAAVLRLARWLGVVTPGLSRGELAIATEAAVFALSRMPPGTVPRAACRTCGGTGRTNYEMRKVVPKNMNANRERTCRRCKGAGTVRYR